MHANTAVLQSAHSLDGLAYSRPTEPLPVTALPSGLSRTQQLLASQALSIPVFPSYDAAEGGLVCPVSFEALELGSHGSTSVCCGRCWTGRLQRWEAGSGGLLSWPGPRRSACCRTTALAGKGCALVAAAPAARGTGADPQEATAVQGDLLKDLDN